MVQHNGARVGPLSPHHCPSVYQALNDVHIKEFEHFDLIDHQS